MTPSEGYKKQEEDNKKKEQEIIADETEKNTKVYWSQPSRLRLANFHKEVKGTDGTIVRPEGSLRFENHIFSTNDPEKIKYIENSESFRANTIILCKGGMAEARRKTMELKVVKNVKEYSAEDVSTVNIRDK